MNESLQPSVRGQQGHDSPAQPSVLSLCSALQAFMEEVKSRGPYIYSVLESAQAFLSQHPFEELEEPTSESKGLWNPPFLVLP